MALAHVWDWFAQDFWPYYRSNGFGVPSLASFEELRAWAEVRKIDLQTEDALLLKRIDAEFLATLEKGKGKKANQISVDNPAGVRALIRGLGEEVVAAQKLKEGQTN